MCSGGFVRCFDCFDCSIVMVVPVFQVVMVSAFPVVSFRSFGFEYTSIN